MQHKIKNHSNIIVIIKTNEGYFKTYSHNGTPMFTNNKNKAWKFTTKESLSNEVITANIEAYQVEEV